jgi:uncharacterized protein YlxW (UPF0749 family)
MPMRSLVAVAALSIVAISINACDRGANQQEQQEREAREKQELLSKMASQQAKVERLQQQLEDEKDEPHPHRGMPRLEPPTSAEIQALLSATKGSASVKPAAPRCTCKKEDPLCDCL